MTWQRRLSEPGTELRLLSPNPTGGTQGVAALWGRAPTPHRVPGSAALALPRCVLAAPGQAAVPPGSSRRWPGGKGASPADVRRGDWQRPALYRPGGARPPLSPPSAPGPSAERAAGTGRSESGLGSLGGAGGGLGAGLS